MAKLSPKKLTVEDFQEQSSWIGKLLQSINDFFSQVYQLANNGMTIEDNLMQELRDVKFTLDSNSYPIKIKSKFNVYPKALTVVYCRDTAGVGPTTAPWVTWSYSDGQLILTDITGLTTGRAYIIKIHVIYG